MAKPKGWRASPEQRARIKAATQRAWDRKTEAQREAHRSAVIAGHRRMSPEAREAWAAKSGYRTGAAARAGGIKAYANKQKKNHPTEGGNSTGV